MLEATDLKVATVILELSKKSKIKIVSLKCDMV